MIWLIGLSAAVVVAVGIATYSILRRRGGASAPEGREGGESLPWRKNVLAALAMAYASLLVVFGLMLLNGVDAKDAFNAVNVPFVALVGGTLAIVKDLV